MKDDYIYNLWKDFVNHDNYKIYFEYYNKYNKKKLWIYQLNEIKKYINKNNKKPLPQDENTKIKKLGKWLYNQYDKFSNPINIKKNDIYYKLWNDFINDDNYKIYFQDKKTLWINKLNEIKTYIFKYDKLPLDNNILSNWINTQKTNYYKKTQIMNDDEIYNLWTDFINDNYYNNFFNNNKLWIDKLNKVKEYLNINNKKPPKNNTLRFWIDNQQANYNKKKHIMSEEIYYNLWTEFINDDNYKIYFLDKNTIWINILNKIKKYIDENNKLPLDNKFFSSWIYRQKNNYYKNTHIMKDENINYLWKQFINDDNYNKYF
jgi:hypothetical protein